MSARKVIIIGSGPAGLTAAIYASRANLMPLMIEGEPTGPGDQPGGQLMNTTEIENYPGVLGVQGPELMAKMREQAASFGTEILSKRVTKVDLSRRPFKVECDGAEFKTDTIIVATGAKPLMLGVAGEWDLVGRGVSTCATCDGFFFRGKDIVVVGGGDSAMEEALFLTKFAKSVTVIHRRDRLRASHTMAARAMANDKIKFVWNKTVSALHGEQALKSLTLTDAQDGTSSEFDTDGLFIAIGHQPNSSVFEGQLKLTESGYIVTDGVSTSVPGVFACGDVQDSFYRQAITSAGTGCMAAIDAEHFLTEQSAAKPIAPTT